MSRRVPTLAGRASFLACGALLLAAPLAHADWVASPAEERAWRAKLKQGVPPLVGQVLKLPPGATLDVECSVKAMSGEDSYVFRVKAPQADVERWLKDNPPDATLGSAYASHEWCESGSGTTDILLRTYPPAKAAKLKAEADARRAAIANLAANEPTPEKLGLPLPAGATYDAECTYETEQTRKGREERYESVWCYAVPGADSYGTTLEALRAVGVPYGEKTNNVEVQPRTTRAPIRIAYWIGRGGPTVPLAEWRAAHPVKSAASASSSGAAPAATAPSSTPSAPAAAPSAPAAAPPTPSKPDAVNAAKDTVNKLKGLFGR